MRPETSAAFPTSPENDPNSTNNTQTSTSHIWIHPLTQNCTNVVTRVEGRV